MKRILGVCMTAAFILGVTSMGMAGQEMKSGSAVDAEKNVPEHIQRSTPSAEKSLPDGSGPGSREDHLTEMGDVDSPSGKSKSDQAARDLKDKNKKAPISSQSSSGKNH